LGITYTPELFPGMRIRLDGVTAVIFHSGKCNLLGAKTLLDLQAAALELYIRLN
jgi:TATA-box binding protein (TBP) (component of TFIID and TFIIIB)